MARERNRIFLIRAAGLTVLIFGSFVVPAEQSLVSAESWQKVEGTSLCVDRDSESDDAETKTDWTIWTFRGCAGGSPQVRLKFDCISQTGPLIRNVAVPAYADAEGRWISISVGPDIEAYKMIKKVCGDVM